MSTENEYLPKTISYFRKYLSAHLQDIYEEMREYRTYPDGGYESFYGDSEVMQTMVNIYYNLSEKFSNLSIPENFSSPKKLAHSIMSLYEFLKKDDDIFDTLRNKFIRARISDTPIVFAKISNRRDEIIAFLEHILSFDEIKEYLNQTEVNVIENLKKGHSSNESIGNTKLALEIESSIEPEEFEATEIHNEEEEEIFNDNNWNDGWDNSSSSNEFQKLLPNKYQVIILTAIMTEFAEVKKILNTGKYLDEMEPSRATYYEDSIVLKTGNSVKILLVCMNQMGMVAASPLVSRLIYKYQPKLVSMCGIAAGIEGKIGDVMVPDLLWDYGSGKNKEFPIKKFWRKIEWKSQFVPYRYPKEITPSIIGLLHRIKNENEFLDQIHADSEYKYTDRASAINIHIGPFVSGSAVIADNKLLEKIKSQEGKLIGFDMEAYGVVYAVSISEMSPQPYCLIMKSISDHGDRKKANPDKEMHQKYAAYTSAKYLLETIKNYPNYFKLG